jgi:hypothetical protein
VVDVLRILEKKIRALAPNARVPEELLPVTVKHPTSQFDPRVCAELVVQMGFVVVGVHTPGTVEYPKIRIGFWEPPLAVNEMAPPIV